MCSICGCNQSDGALTITKIGEEVIHKNQHSLLHHHHSHEDHHHHHPVKTLVDLEKDILSENNLMAERNRGFLEAKQVLGLNLVSSPGSGKTTLLEKTIHDLKDELDFF